MSHHERSPRGVREQIIQLAARLMAEEHIDDYAQAKRKAARRLGLAEGKHLPGNEEIDAALRQYREIYQPDHPEVLASLRRKALAAMQRFAQFRPYLVGSVRSGTAGPHSDINLVVYTDNDKAVEIHCLNHQIDYRVESHPGGHSTLAFELDGSLVRLAIRAEKDERQVRQSSEGSERLRIAQLQALLQEEALPG